MGTSVATIERSYGTLIEGAEPTSPAAWAGARLSGSATTRTNAPLTFRKRYREWWNEGWPRHWPGPTESLSCCRPCSRSRSAVSVPKSGKSERGEHRGLIAKGS
jgi:hypothetical protein